jgi:GAF domain-containing protein
MASMFEPLTEQIHRCGDAQSLAECLLHHGLKLSGARLGNVQLMNSKDGYLEIKAQSGFSDEFLNFFKRVDVADVSACARALRRRNSIVIEDVTTDQQFAPYCEILHRAGVRAVQSTPMLTSGGALMGILSTHFPIPHRLTHIEMRNLLHAAHIAADALVSIRVNGGTTTGQPHCKRCGGGMLLVTVLSREDESRLNLFRCLACDFYDLVKA